MPSLTTTRTITTSRAAASPYPHSRSRLLATSGGSSDTDEQSRSRRYGRKANVSLTTTRCSARLQVKALPAQAEYEEMKKKAEVAQQKVLKLETIHAELLTCPVCLDFAYQPQITQCGHLHCATCLNNIRVHSIEAQDFTQCGLCRGDLYLPPVPCRPLQDLIESIATTDGLTIPDYVADVWVDRP